MATYFEVVCRYDKTQENGSVKKSNEPYIIDALSFTEAESTAVEKVTPYAGGEMQVRSIRRTPIAEIINPDGDKFFLAKVSFVTLDEKTGAEKKSVSQMLVGGADIDGAKAQLEDAMRGTVSDWELASLAETNIVEVFLHGQGA